MEDSLKERLKNLSPHQQALLQKRLVNAAQALPHQEKVPLSFAQNHIWLLEQLYSNQALHHIAGIVVHRGSLEVECLYRAFNQMVVRHEVLRTAFIMGEEHPFQAVKKSYDLSAPVINLTELSEEEKKLIARQTFLQEAKRPFDLASGQLLRVLIVQYLSDEYHIMVCMHHIISDGWSTGILLRETLQYYDALVKRAPLFLSPLPLQYIDYTLQQHKNVQEHNKQLHFWKEQLKSIPPQLDLPFDHIRPTTAQHQAGRVKIELSNSLSAAVKTFANQEKVTPFMLLFSIYALLLHRYTNQHDFVIGVPVAGRNSPGLEHLIGCFINLLAFRVKILGKPTFRSFLQWVREQYLLVFSHDTLPFSSVVSALQLERDINQASFFQAAFSFEHQPEMDSFYPDYSIDFEEMDLGIARYDLSLELTWNERTRKIEGWLDYNRDVFDDETPRRMIASFMILTEEALRQPDQLVQSLPILSAQDRELLITQWNQTALPYPNAATITQLFSEQTSHASQQPALKSSDRQISYAQLDDLSNRLQITLVQQKVIPGSIIAIYMDSSIEAVIAMLGILKAGCAYLPLNKQDPVERLITILDEVTVSAVVLLKKDHAQFVGIGHATSNLVNLDTCLQASVTTFTPPVSRRATDLACVMYTSGSTGKPKGVMISHRNIIRLVKYTNYASLGKDEVGLLLAPLAFDASIFEIWGQLLNGGTLAVAPPQPLSFDEIGRCIESYGVTILWLTAGLFHAMVEEKLSDFMPLKQLIVGGDVLSKYHVEKFLKAIPECQLINGYGPTEGTTFSCCHLIQLPDLEKKSIPIGRPIANTSIYLLDDYLQPVPIGVTGTLYIGGEGIALGYFADAALTEQRFIRNPFDGITNLYNTGDQARYHTDGTIEFLGRLDSQIKLRGFRIELKEIENILLEHPLVKAVVIAIQGELDQKQLCAYIVLKPQAPIQISNNDLREYLSDKLPQYMIPHFFVRLDELPLTANGKVDKKRLPQSSMTTQLTDAYVKPQGQMEQYLAEIWKNLLHVEQVGRHDNFFTSGGDSIKAVQLVARAHQKGLKISTKIVFMHQTLSNIASATQHVEDVQLQVEPTVGSVVLTPIQRWFFEQKQVQHSHWNQWILYRLDDFVSPDILETALRLLIEQQDIFRLRFRKNAQQWEQYAIASSSFNLQVHSLPQEGVELHTLLSRMQRTLDIEHGPLFQAALIIGPEEQQQRVFMTAHHLIIDQVSWYLLTEWLHGILGALQRQEQPRLPTIKTSFISWANQLEKHYDDNELQTFYQIG
jgi:amino acid adenylation domain-containing protein